VIARPATRILLAAIGAAAMAAAALASHLPGGVPGPQQPVAPLFEGTRIDSETLRIFERACQSCHSERTKWPWYSHIPGAAWLVRKDVEQARSRLNLSHWLDYTAEERRFRLGAIGTAVRAGTMPPARYTMLHRAAQLSAAEREQIYRWTRKERSSEMEPVWRKVEVPFLP
jgi:cytochrome c